MQSPRSLKDLARSVLLVTWCVAFPLCPRLPAVQKRPFSVKPLREYSFAALRMGTEFRIVLFASDPSAAQKAALAAFNRVEELENIMSDYREDSEVMLLCRAPAGTPRVVTPELFHVLETALRISRLSGGAFDVTIGPVSRLWREARKNKRPPSAQEIASARRFVGYTNITLEPDARAVSLKLEGMRIDLGGIGKGYAADEALEVLNSRGFTAALVQAGGEVVAGKSPPGKPGWRIAIREPDSADPSAPGELVLHDRGVSTSGDAFQYLEIDGARYSHIIDPANGTGLKGSPVVTVVARDGVTADALATALDVMPAPDGLRLVESIEGASALITRHSPGGLHHLYSKGFPGGPDRKLKPRETPKRKGTG